MAHTPRHRLVAAVLAAAVATSGANCFKAAATIFDDVARVTGRASDDVRLLAQRDAQRAVGQSADEVADGWLVRMQQVGKSYTAVPTEARSVACDVTTSWIAAMLTDQMAEFSVVAEVAQAVVALNSTHGAKQLGDELQDALNKRSQGQPYAGAVLAINTGACQVASQ
jgi:hypothetical protein